MNTNRPPNSVDRVEVWWFQGNDDDFPFIEYDEIKRDVRKREVRVKTPDGEKIAKIGDWIVASEGRFYVKRF